MSITATTLTAAVVAGDITIGVASATGAAVKNLINIDNEFFKQTSDAIGTMIPVRGGVEGSYNKAHSLGAVVLMGLPSDFPAAPPGTCVIAPYAPAWIVNSYTLAGAIAVPATRHNVYVQLLGGTARAMTLADPGLGLEGLEMLIQAESAQAFTVTNTTGFNSAGASGDVATFGGAIGDNLHIKAVGGKWNIVTKTNVTLA